MSLHGDSLTSTLFPCCSSFVETIDKDLQKSTLSSISDAEIERQLVANFGQMDMKERNQIMHEAHGVVDVVEETDDFVATKLAELNFHLLQVKKRETFLRMPTIFPCPSLQGMYPAENFDYDFYEPSSSMFNWRQNVYSITLIGN